MRGGVEWMAKKLGRWERKEEEKKNNMKISATQRLVGCTTGIDLCLMVFMLPD
jgi:hypothetical protein